MQPMKSAMNMQLVTNTHYKRLCNDKNCQSTRCYKIKSPVKQRSVCSDNNCQEITNVHMQPGKLAKELSKMQLVTRSSDKKSIRPASDKNHQAAKCFKRNCPVRPVGDDKNCQPANFK